jgi:hypothetical protein
MVRNDTAGPGSVCLVDGRGRGTGERDRAGGYPPESLVAHSRIGLQLRHDHD